MERSWIYRRMAFFGIVGACFAIFVMIIWIGSDTMLNREGIQSITLIILGCIGAYFGGSLMDDRFKGKELIDRYRAAKEKRSEPQPDPPPDQDMAP